MYFKGVSLSCQQLIVVDELKNDYRNPVDFASNLNMVSEVLKIMYVCSVLNSYLLAYAFVGVANMIEGVV